MMLIGNYSTSSSTKLTETNNYDLRAAGYSSGSRIQLGQPELACLQPGSPS
jgi:hypothetical protein